MTQKLFILSHKKIKHHLKGYKILQTGTDCIKKDLYFLKDNIGDNISSKNKNWLESTGVYWIWKNIDSDIKGHTQYRRFLSVNPELIPNILENNDMIVSSPIQLDLSLYDHYKYTHNINDLNNCKKIILRDYPEYEPSWTKFIEQNNILFYNDAFIAKKEVYDKACEFIFDVLFKLEKEYLYSQELIDASAKEAAKNGCTGCHNISSFEYNQRIFSVLFERLFTLYILHNNLKLYICGPYVTTEEGIV